MAEQANTDEKQKQQESQVIFDIGCMMGLASRIKRDVLEQFLKSDRSAGDFHYKVQGQAVLDFLRKLDSSGI